jgi:HEAT repeat protein
VLCEAPQPEAVTAIVEHLGDDDPAVSGCALLALKAAARTIPDAVRASLVTLARAPVTADRLTAVRALGLVRDPLAVPQVMAALGDDDDRVVAAAYQSLMEITRQDFGTDALHWMRWWETHASRHRIEWLIDALTHDTNEMRRAAGDELRAVTRQYFGYASDLPQRDRERAQQRYRDWWAVEGMARFRGG